MDESVTPEPRRAGVDTPASARSEPGALTTAGACPFLIAAGGAWRMTVPDREHRCAAFRPATSLAVAKQARLCLTPNHLGCATYLASTAAREARIGSSPKVDRAGRWGLARTMPIVEQVGGLRATVGALLADRRTWPTIPAVLMATLLVALGLSGSWSQGTATARATPTPTAPSSRSPAPTERASQPTSSEVPPTTSPSTAPTPGPSVTPSATPAVANTTYRVKSGDTLYVIARRFHTTVKAIQRLNGLTTTTLHVGQVLKIPKT